jgi:hypothetical protein
MRSLFCGELRFALQKNQDAGQKNSGGDRRWRRGIHENLATQNVPDRTAGFNLIFPMRGFAPRHSAAAWI